MKKFAIVVAFLAIVAIVQAGPITPELAKTVVTEANKLVDATFGKDFEKLVEMMHPKIVDIMGGREQALQFLKNL